jgi:hypothetical protein
MRKEETPAFEAGIFLFGLGVIWSLLKAQARLGCGSQNGPECVLAIGPIAN